MKIRNELDSQAVSALPAQTDSFSGITQLYVVRRCTCFVLARMLLVILYNSLEQLVDEILLL